MPTGYSRQIGERFTAVRQKLFPLTEIVVSDIKFILRRQTGSLFLYDEVVIHEHIIYQVKTTSGEHKQFKLSRLLKALFPKYGSFYPVNAPMPGVQRRSGRPV